MAAIAADAQLGLSMRFEVVIDGFELGSWSTCKGLSVSFKHEKVKELGEHTMNAFIPGWVEYPPIQLTRAMAKADWDKTKEWLQTVASAPWLLADNPVSDAVGSVATAGMSSAKITLRDATDAEVASWELAGVLPNSWKGPQFDANGKTVAIETLELVHEGFLVCLNV
jgi:phage tail-like protein